MRGKIVHFIPYSGSGGVEGRVKQIIAIAEKSAYEHIQDSLENALKYRFIFSYIHVFGLSRLLRLRTYINKHYNGDDTLILYMPECRYLISIIRNFIKPKIVIVLTSEYYKTYYVGPKKHLLFFDRMLFQNIKKIAISNAVKKDAELASLNVHSVIRNVVQLNQNADIPLKSGKICIPGRLHPSKGHMEFLEFSKDLILDYDLKIDIIGSGSLSAALHSYINHHHLADNIEIIEGLSRDEFIALLPSYRMVIVPSIREGLGNVILEANYYNIPVLTTGAGGIRELIDMGGVGHIYKSKKDLEGYILKFKDGSISDGIRRRNEFFDMDNYICKWQSIHETLHT